MKVHTSVKKSLLFFVFLAQTLLVHSQTHTLSGYLRDAASGEELLYATVSVPSLNQGATTNEYGFYSLTLPEGNYQVVYSYVGYESKSQEVALHKDLRLDVELGAGTVLQEVQVTASREDENVRSTQMSTATISIKDAKLLPVLFGEQDILKTIQLLPGVSPNSEGNAGFFVRGGDADQNLVLLDEAPVYNASHLLGFFSVFNSDALKDVKLYKGGIPAQYGGRISSVLDIRMKNGNSKSTEISGGIGLIASRLTVETPLGGENGSIILSGRRTYADLILKAASNDFDETTLYFYDFNAKANYTISEKDRLYLSGYFGRDVFSLGQVGLDWGNTTGTLRWNHVFNDKLFSNVSFIYSDFDYGFGVDNAGTSLNLTSGIFNYNLKQDFNWYANPENSIQFGWNTIVHQFKPGKFTSDEGTDTSEGAEIDLPRQQALETGFYIDNEQKISPRLSAYYGLRLSSFSNIGAFDLKTYNEADEVIATTSYAKNDFYHTTLGFEPRASATLLLSNNSSVKASYNRMYQYLHLLSNSTSGTPTDLWIPSTPLVKPEIGDQWAMGYFRNFKENAYEFSVEGYYKTLQNQVDYEDGAETFLNPDLEAELVFGKGRAYGLEFFLKKNSGPLTGWISYTLSKSERQFDAINGGQWFSARQDRTHDFSVVATYQLSPKLTLSGAWVYYTGDAVTFPTGKYEVDGEIITLFSGRNGDRMPDYHRLDLGLTWALSEKTHWSSDLNFSVYNAYNRKNAFSITFEESETDPGKTEAIKTSLFGIVPSVTWNFRWK
ncbi:MAG: TonB-dependent receptor [Saprospiraceae bacterium]|nr:TonB-dependent receptor [Saprospiraceae bacterium]